MKILPNILSKKYSQKQLHKLQIKWKILGIYGETPIKIQSNSHSCYTSKIHPKLQANKILPNSNPKATNPKENKYPQSKNKK